MLELQDEKAHKICFTHGDINSYKILASAGKIVGLVDFEYAGFYTEYWEYLCAINLGPDDFFWQKDVGKFLKPYPRALEMETIRRKHFEPRGFQGRYMWH